MAKFCTGCGMELSGGLMFCTDCGTKAPENTPPAEEVIQKQEEKVAEEPVAEVKAEEPAQQAAQPQQNAPPPPNNQQYIPRQNTPPAARAQPQYNQQGQYQQQYQPPPQQTVYTPPPLPREILDSDVKGTKYEPISAWGFIGIMLLMCIPIIGQILVIIWACGGCRKLSKRAYARASLILMAIALVISLIISIAAGSFMNFLSKNIEANADEPGGIAAIFSSITAGEDGDDKLSGLAGILSAFGGEGGEGLSGLLGNVEDINTDAEKKNNGWPKSLRKYPGGKSRAVASYRTEISETTEEEMFSWIEDLKKDGYKYQDFYEMGMSEQDMIDMNSWWATNGKLYLSISYADGTVTVDHMNELPDLESYFN